MRLFDGTDNFVVVDVETTGLSYSDARVIEIGAVKVEHGNVTAKFDKLIKTVDDISLGTTLLTGITQEEFDQNAKDPVKAIKEFRDFIEDFVFIAHNVYFDFDFVNSEFYRYDQPIVVAPRLCSVRVARKGMPYLPSYKLGFLKDYMGLKFRSHRGLDDAMVALEIVNRYGDLVPLDNTVVDDKRYGNIAVIPMFGKISGKKG
ncbi:3'-5' exonuclease [Candidatus Dojkabacteria bacterium]|nr:3'-5' exonuclease [Candidatus Dojkabacteria bacterium]